MNWEAIEGIFLSLHLYEDNSQIGTAYTKTHGKISFFLRSLNKAQPNSPLSHFEGLIRPGRSELYQIKDLVVKNAFLSLRSSYSVLSTAASFAKILAQTQEPLTPSPNLYKLTHLYLKECSKAPQLKSLELSFALKIARHDGLIGTPWNLCEICGRPAAPVTFSKGVFFCPVHSPQEALYFTHQEIDHISTLIYSLSLEQIGTLFLEDLCIKKINHLIQGISP